MQEKLFSIYKITNKINGKIYIGKSVNPRARFASHKSTALKNSGERECSKLYRSMRKYGVDNFSIEILISFTNEDECYQAEVAYINKLDTIINGLNITPGGKGGCASGRNHPFWGKKLSDEHKQKLSLSHLGHKDSEETKTRKSLAQRGEKSHYAKLSENDVDTIRKELSLGVKVAILARRYNVSLTTIYYIRNGITWK